MATDFTYNGKTIYTSGGFQPTTTNTPADVRTRINVKADMASVPKPFIGMQILVLQDESNGGKMTEYRVKTLKADGLGVQNSVIDEVVLLKDFIEATSYTHPASHPASIIVQDATNRFVTDAEKVSWNAKEPAITKATAFNKNFGTTAGTVSEGNHTHASDSTKVDKVAGKSLIADTEITRLAGVTNYTHPTTAGNKHIPTGGSTGQVLGWESNGTAKWVDNTASGSTTNADTTDGKHISDIMTQAEYDAIVTKDPDTIYLVEDTEEYYSRSEVDAIIAALNARIAILEGGGTPPISYGEIIVSKTLLTINEGENGSFTVKLSKAPSNDQVVTLSKNNLDVSLNNTTLTFTPENYNVEQTINVSVLEDQDFADESCLITLSSPNVSNKTVTVNIIDNDIEPPANDYEIIEDGLVLNLDGSDETTKTRDLWIDKSNSNNDFAVLGGKESYEGCNYGWTDKGFFFRGTYDAGSWQETPFVVNRDFKFDFSQAFSFSLGFVFTRESTCSSNYIRSILQIKDSANLKQVIDVNLGAKRIQFDSDDTSVITVSIFNANYSIRVIDGYNHIELSFEPEYDGTYARATMNLNGVECQQFRVNRTNVFSAQNYIVHLGEAIDMSSSLSRSSRNQFDDEIRCFRIYNRKISRDEMLTNYIASLETDAKNAAIARENKVIPRVDINGDLSGINAESTIPATITFNGDGHSFTKDIKIEWQGSGSLAYQVKNYGIDITNEDGSKYYHAFKNWYASDSFHLKANYMDSSNFRNIVAANISRDISDGLPRETISNGFIEGFPIELYVNGELQGIYTWNLKQDRSLFAMDSAVPTDLFYRVAVGNEAALFSDWTNEKIHAGWESRNTKNKTEHPELARLIEWVATSSDEDFVASFDQYLDKTATLNFYLLGYMGGFVDSFCNNMSIVSYDGLVWYPILYDMDNSFESHWNNSLMGFKIEPNSTTWGGYNSVLWTRVRALLLDDLKIRYAELRETEFKTESIINRFKSYIDEIPLNLINYNNDFKYSMDRGNSTFSSLEAIKNKGVWLERMHSWINFRLAYCDGVLGYSGNDVFPSAHLPEEKRPCTTTIDFVTTGVNQEKQLYVGAINTNESSTIVIDWGDGTDDVVISTNSGAIVYKHIYANAGSYTTTITCNSNNLSHLHLSSSHEKIVFNGDYNFLISVKFYPTLETIVEGDFTAPNLKNLSVYSSNNGVQKACVLDTKLFNNITSLGAEYTVSLINNHNLETFDGIVNINGSPYPGTSKLKYKGNILDKCASTTYNLNLPMIDFLEEETVLDLSKFILLRKFTKNNDPLLTGLTNVNNLLVELYLNSTGVTNLDFITSNFTFLKIVNIGNTPMSSDLAKIQSLVSALPDRSSTTAGTLTIANEEIKTAILDSCTSKNWTVA